MTEPDTATIDVAVSAPTRTVSVKPVVLSAPDRGEDLRVRVSAPATGNELPIIVFSHGFGSSLEGYGPLATSGLLTASWSFSPPIWTRGAWAFL